MESCKDQRGSQVDTTGFLIRLTLAVCVILIGGVALLPQHWHLLVILTVTCLAWLIAWHTSCFAYRCASCSHEFQISVTKNFVSPHIPVAGGGQKRLRCPRCSATTWASMVVPGGL
jgi:DNA-directed RNA polymerase subunit RPC12/RpoP